MGSPIQGSQASRSRSAGWLESSRRAWRFVALSGVGWLLDTLVYTALVAAEMRVLFAAVLGGLCGAAFAFITSHRLVFLQHGAVPIGRLCIYLIYTVLLVVLFSYVIEVATYALQEIGGIYRVEWPLTHWAFLAKCLVTPLTLAMNFFVARTMLVAWSRA